MTDQPTAWSGPGGYVDRDSLAMAGIDTAPHVSIRAGDVVPFTRLLAERVEWVIPVMHREEAAGRISPAATAATIAFTRRLIGTLRSLALRHGRQQLSEAVPPLVIDPVASGFPTASDFLALHSEVAGAPTILAGIPQDDQLLAQALDHIFRGVSPGAEQLQWLERRYLRRLEGNQTLAPFAPLKLVFDQSPESTSGIALTLTWYRTLTAVNRFDVVTAQGTMLPGVRPIEPAQLSALDVPGLEHPPLHALVDLLVTILPGFVPEAIERVHVGPCFHQWTRNDALIERAFAAVDPGEQPFMLRLHVERASISRTPGKARLGGLFGSEPDTYTCTAQPVSRIVITSSNVKQLLGDRDEDNQPAHIYGMTSDGDLIY